VAENLILEAEPRALVGKKVSQLRRQGLVPVALYGPRVEPISAQIAYRPLEQALLSAGGTHLIDLKVGKNTHIVLARDVQRDVIRGEILHVDFFVVDETQVISTDVPIHFVNESPAVLARKGILLTGPSMLSIETLPSKLLSVIDIDLATLNEVGDAIYVHNLDLGEGVKILNDPDEMICRISQTSAARSEEDIDGAEMEGGAAEPEIIHKGKEDDKDF
jgi:large subunit ribosomal protein L25